MVRPVMQWTAVVVTIVMVIVIMVLSVHAPAMRAQNPVVVTLASTTSPNAGEPGVTNMDVVGSNFPSGTIPPANVSVTLKPAVAGPPGATTTATAVGAVIGSVRRVFRTDNRSHRGAVIGSVRRVFFVVPSSINVSAPTAYKVSLSGTTSTGAAFSSGNTSSLTINPPAQLLLVSPSSGQAGSSVPVTLTGSFTTFVQ